jgi:hypothetical protein
MSIFNLDDFSDRMKLVYFEFTDVRSSLNADARLGRAIGIHIYPDIQHRSDSHVLPSVHLGLFKQPNRSVE